MKNQKSRALFFLPFIVVIALSGCASEADKETVQAVSRQISEIGEVTLEKADMINEIQKAYESLNEKQKKLLDNYETLESASAVLKELTEEEEMKKDPTYSITKDDWLEYGRKMIRLIYTEGIFILPRMEMCIIWQVKQK